MSNFRPVFTKLITFLFILFHLGCFLIHPTTTTNHHHRRRKPPSSPLPLLRPTKLKSKKPNKLLKLSSTWSFIKRILIFHSKPGSQPETQTTSIIHYVPASPASSTRTLTRPGSLTDSDFFPLRNGIYPCTNCGEIFQKPGLLEQHQSVKHAVSELPEDDPGKNIVRIIFQTGWPGPGSGSGTGSDPNVYRVTKIHNCPKILTRFEEYREQVKSTAARHGGFRRRDERCVADGNELLRFYCATFLCDLGQDGNSSVCNHQYCSVCEIIRVGFSAKMDGISTYSTSWKGHVALPDDIEEEFRFMHVKRAMLVCRVIAGRVGLFGCEPGDKDDPGYDSLVGRAGSCGTETRVDDEDEIIVFNPRAVLPCFVIAYTV
ncbi:uncharacterized protein LOC143554866 [Bidens hawaiensis]|uniref:uncharacterized protein LOC143554866 n=1 Tax=Bidens hawaiensis TaxID=980011 RepID=UPI00404AE172